MDFVNSIPEFGSRYQFPENIRFEYDGYVGKVTNEIVVQMAEKYDAYLADKIAMAAMAEGISDITVLNKEAIMGAMRKQVPQLPIMNQDEILCPACKWDMMGVWDYPDVRDPKYCPECGQRLKWKE